MEYSTAKSLCRRDPRPGVLAWLVQVGILVTITTLARAQPAAPPVGGARVLDTISCLNLRVEPERSAAAIACLPAGEPVEVLEVAPDWARVRTEDGQRGWVASRFLAASEPPVPGRAPASDRPEPSPDSLSDDSEELRSRADAAREREADLARQLDDIEANVGLLREILDEYRREEAELLGERLRLVAELGRGRDEVEALTAQLAALEAEERELMRKIDSAARSVGDLSARLPPPEAPDDERSASADLEERLQGVDEEVRELEQSLSEAQERQRGLAEELAGSRERIGALEDEAAERRRAEAALEEELARRRESAPALEAQLAEAVATLAGLRERVEAGRELEDELARELASSTERVAELRQRVAEAGRLEADLVEQLEVLETATSVLVASRERAESVWADLEASRARERELVAELAASKERIAGIEAEEDGSRREEPDPGDIFAFVRAWAAAWQEQRIDEYLGFYARDFVPAEGVDRARWDELRRTPGKRPQFRDIRIGTFEVISLGERRAAVRFPQDDHAVHYGDQVVRGLDLVRENGVWRIARETVDQIPEVP